MAKKGNKKYELSEHISNYNLDKRLTFLFELHERDVSIGRDRIRLLQKHGYIKMDEGKEFEVNKKENIINRALNKDYTIKSDPEIIADEYVDVVNNDIGSVVTQIEYDSKEHYIYKGKKI